MDARARVSEARERGSDISRIAARESLQAAQGVANMQAHAKAYRMGIELAQQVSSCMSRRELKMERVGRSHKCAL